MKSEVVSILISAMLLFSIAPVASADGSLGSVGRTIDSTNANMSKNYIKNNQSIENLTITLTPSSGNGTTFNFYKTVENIPENLNVILVSGHNITKDGSNYTIYSLTTAPIVYNISINQSARPENNSRLQINGTFKDSYNATGTTSPTESMIYIGRDIYREYDLNQNDHVDRSEVIQGIWDYFYNDPHPTVGEIIDLIIKYFAGGTIS